MIRTRMPDPMFNHRCRQCFALLPDELSEREGDPFCENCEENPYVLKTLYTLPEYQDMVIFGRSKNGCWVNVEMPGRG